MTGKFPVMHKIIKKNVKFQLTNGRGYGILLKKTKKVGASASPPAAGKEVNSVIQTPVGTFVSFRGCRERPRFYFGLEVLRY